VPCRIECASEAADDQAADSARVAKADLGLGGVHVDVHFIARKLNEEGDDRVTVAGEEVLIGAPRQRRSAAGPSPAGR
jgi:hypothetical protein